MDEKRKTFDVKSFIKKEGLSGTRLTSLGLPRDLNLGNKPKKLYTPNLNVVRNKDKKKEIIRNKIEEAKKQHRPRQKPERQPQQIVHAAGVFSEGFQSTFGPTYSSSRNYHSREGESSSATIHVPKYDKLKVDHSSEVSVVDKLLDNFIDSCSDDDQDMPPTCLSFDIKKGVWSQPNLLNVDKYDDEHPYILALKMPESLSGKYFAEDSDDKNNDYRLRDMNEGQIGKLIMRRSGKIEVQIGNVKYSLNQDNNNPCYEEIICTPFSSSECILTKLGTVNDRFMMVPEWDTILK